LAQFEQEPDNPLFQKSGSVRGAGYCRTFGTVLSEVFSLANVAQRSLILTDDEALTVQRERRAGKGSLRGAQCIMLLPRWPVKRMPSLCASMRRIVALPCLAAASLLCGGAMADINKWIDPGGGVNYGDHPPSWADTMPVSIRPNVIDTDRIGLRSVIVKSLVRPAPPADQAAAETRVDLESYVEQCWKNRGVDCELEARQMIDGPAPVIFPGDPAVFPRPDVRPPPPGLPLKFSITP
jgi:hypothetical protein